jgi:hypothetical protein
VYNIAAYPEYVVPLREEVENLLSISGWDTVTLSKMTKLDSFLKETLRIHVIASSMIPSQIQI